MSEESSAAGQQERICLGRAPPDLDCDPCVETLEDRLLRGNVTPARDAPAESAQDGQRVGLESGIGAPDDGDVVDVLGVEGVAVRAIIGDLVSYHGLGAVKASILGVRGADGDVQGSEGVAKRLGKHVSWASAWDETRKPRFRQRDHKCEPLAVQPARQGCVHAWPRSMHRQEVWMAPVSSGHVLQAAHTVGSTRAPHSPGGSTQRQ